MKPVKNSIIPPKKHGGPGLIAGQGGFAIVLALVVMTFLFTVGASLTATRQIWGFTATKQLDRSTIDLAARADMSMWFSNLRYTMQNSGSCSFGGASPLGLPAAAATFGFSQYGGSGSSQMFQPSPPYPEYPTNATTWTYPTLFDTTQSYSSTPLSPFDPYWGTTSFNSVVGAVFDQEMTEASRSLRVGRFDSSTTKLRAWMSLDAGLSASAYLRCMPVSVFTLFSSQAPSTFSNAVSLSSSWLTSSAAAYSFAVGTNSPTYGVSGLGVGRLYVEGPVTVDSAISWAFPAVFPSGISGGTGSMGFTFPSALTSQYGGSLTGVIPSPAAILQNRRTLYGGMVITDAEPPSRLLRAGMSKGADGLWVNAPLTNPTAGLGAALLSQVAVRVVVNVATNAYVQTNTSFQGLPTNGVYVPSARIYTNGVVPGFDPVASQYSTTGFGGGVAAEWYKLFSVNNWEVDQAGKEIIFHPPSNFYDQFLIPPTSISVEVAGASPGWTIRVVCPNVASLSANSANRKLTFVSLFSSIKLDGGFNGSASDKGSMIVSPVVSVVNPRIGSMPATPVVGGVVLTECLDPSAPFYAFDYTGVPKILGSLVVWNRTVIPGLGLSSQRATLQPDSQYLSGEKLPPLVPCVSDVRIGTKSFNTYQMSAVMPTTP